MRKLLILVLVLSAPLVWGQKNIYESGKFDQLSRDHKALAILPFFTDLDLDNVSPEEKHQLEEQEGYAVQNALETYFGRGKKRKKFSVDFQNISNTNAILAQNNITYDNIDTYTIKDLARILNVDGVISGNLNLNILLSRGISTELSLMDYILGAADYGRIGIKVSDGSTGKLLWKYENEINKKSGKNTLEMIDKMMKKATRRFPYDKERQRNPKS